MSVLCAVLAAATRRGEVVALVDTFDSFDPVSGQASGIELSQLLWIRGRQGTSRELPHVIARAIKATELVLQAGGVGIVAMDLGEAPEAAIRRLPFTTWLRLAEASITPRSYQIARSLPPLPSTRRTSSSKKTRKAKSLTISLRRRES